MPLSHHSHSGEFCAHAKNSLADIVSTARRRKMLVFALTEHMPRGDQDLYPEEKEASINAVELEKQFAAYVTQARRLQADEATKDDAQMQILVGFEAEWIRPSEAAHMVQNIMAKHQLDYVVGSVHHVLTIPIDFSRELYIEARQACGGTDEALFEAYYDAQYDMLQALKPKVVGHFDLIRLLSDSPNVDWTAQRYSKLWHKIIRNLEFIVRYGGLVEINTSAWRKGLHDPYPTRELCRAFLDLGGSFVISDDSHGIDHVATNYHKLPDFCKVVGLKEIAYLCSDQGRIRMWTMAIEEFTALPFWETV